MELCYREPGEQDLEQITQIWNEVLEAGDAFPGEAPLSAREMRELLAQQTKTVCAYRDGQVAGLFVLHPNNIGRCSHVANASYAVDSRQKGLGIGKRLVELSLEAARDCGFRGIQFNAVVAGNAVALAIYNHLGFSRVGTIPGGFRLKDGRYSDMHILYRAL